MTGLGDRRPSELLQYMLAMNKDPETLFRALFLNQLPVECQRIVSRIQEPDLAKVAAMADRVLEVDRPPATVSAVGAGDSDSDSDGAPGGAAGGINQVSNSKGFKKSRQGGGGKPPQQQQASSVQQPSSNFVLCKYHAKFGPNAQKCAGKVNGKPCAMTANASTGNERASAK